MGREVKRVPLGFDWPMGTIWRGYLSPYSPIECSACDGSGYNPETKKLSDDWYSHLRTDGREGWARHLDEHDVAALIKADRLWDFTRVPRTAEHREVVREKIVAGGNSWLPFDNGYIPTPEEVNAWARKGIGHDAINHFICVEARARRLGIYGKCPLCKGKGHYWCDDKFEILAKAWEGVDPPMGDGWQLWETTSEGSPVSPVFDSPEQLAVWLADNKASWFGYVTATYEEWLSAILGIVQSIQPQAGADK